MQPTKFEQRREVRFADAATDTINHIEAALSKGEYNMSASLYGAGDSGHPNVVERVIAYFRNKGWGLPPEEKEDDLEGDDFYVKYWESLDTEGGSYIFMTPQIRLDKVAGSDQIDRQRNWLKRKDEAALAVQVAEQAARQAEQEAGDAGS